MSTSAFWPFSHRHSRLHFLLYAGLPTIEVSEEYELHCSRIFYHLVRHECVYQTFYTLRFWPENGQRILTKAQKRAFCGHAPCKIPFNISPISDIPKNYNNYAKKDLILNFARFLNGLTAGNIFVDNNKKWRENSKSAATLFVGSSKLLN